MPVYRSLLKHRVALEVNIHLPQFTSSFQNRLIPWLIKSLTLSQDELFTQDIMKVFILGRGGAPKELGEEVTWGKSHRVLKVA